MAFNVNQFLIAGMALDGARPNLFSIEFPDNIAGPNELFAMRAKATTLPGSSVGVAPAFYFGRQVKFAGNRVFDNWTVTILTDENDFTGTGPRWFLEQWMAQLNTHVSNVRTGGWVAPAQYMRTGRINHYGKRGDIIASYVMEKAFPIDISPVGLDWGNNDTIEEFNVTFAFQYWINAPTLIVDGAATGTVSA